MPSPFGTGFGSLDGKALQPVISQGKATRGKYAGQSFDWILENAPRYLTTLYEKAEDHGGMTLAQYRMAQLAIEQREDEEDERDHSDYDPANFWGGR